MAVHMSFIVSVDTNVAVSVINVNDNAPQFIFPYPGLTGGRYFSAIDVNSNVGTPVVKVSVGFPPLLAHFSHPGSANACLSVTNLTYACFSSNRQPTPTRVTTESCAIPSYPVSRLSASRLSTRAAWLVHASRLSTPCRRTNPMSLRCRPATPRGRPPSRQPPPRSL